MRAHPTIAALLAAVLLAGCALGPRYRRPEVATPALHRGQTEAEPASLADLPWWELFQDTALRELIGTSLAANRDLAVAAARVEQARGFVLVARSEMLPQGGYTGSADRGRGLVIGSTDTFNVFAGVLNAAWEIDLWGRIRRTTEAARAELLASDEFRRGIVLSLVSGVAQAYFELRELDRELEIARRTTASFADTQNLFVRQFQGGVGTKLATARADAAHAQTAASVAELERLVVVKENQLSVLLGRLPMPIVRGATLTDQVVPPTTPAGLPSTLLERRPDVRGAEALLRSANARVGVAITEFFPRIGLTAAYGGRSTELDQITSGAASLWNIGGSVVGPLFQGGRLIGGYEAARADWEASRAEYEQAVLVAFREVSDALIAIDRLRVVYEELFHAVASLNDAYRLSRLRFVDGLASYFEVLEAQQELFPAEIALARVERDRLLAVVQLYRALGGGWTDAPAVGDEIRPESAEVWPPWP
jgi:multidrug efflux system outer membrane protein